MENQSFKAETIVDVLTPLQYAYTKEFDSRQMKVYAAMLSDIPTGILSAAVRECLATKKFLPTIADIRESAYNLYQEAAGTAPMTDDELLTVFKKRANSYLSPAEAFKDKPELAAVARKFGWQRFCTATIENEPFIKKELHAIYMGLHKQEKTTAMRDFRKLDYSKIKGNTLLLEGTKNGD